ncbi:MAG: IS1380 family transposase [Actinobacteria bacterium]|nr:IS1380 family transposase [Actinomycetota bacterium]NDE54761.1 IS1380 family transposase [Actinomycetota bacterium]
MEEFRVKTTVRRQLRIRKQRIARRLEQADRTATERPELAALNINYEIADRTRAITSGGIGAVHLLVRRLGLDRLINDRLGLLKVHLPYHESDHVLNIAYNLLAGGTRLEHLELLRNDEGYLDALGARRIPDPTTAGDFCRRFDGDRIDCLQEIFNDTRVTVWKQQPTDFFREAVLDADGTMVETTGQCKEGMSINYKNQWGYHPLVLSLANTGEPLYVVNRPGNRLSHEQAATTFDKAIALCRRAGFGRIRLRGDTAFSQTEHLDRWAADGVTFVFGIQAMPNLYEQAENLPRNAWQELVRPPKHRVKTEPRKRPDNVKQQVVVEKKFKDIRLAKEYVADFRYQPTKCGREYRIIALWKDLEVHQGQRKLFDDARCFFFITNDFRKSAAELVLEANHRCNQENLFAHLKSDMHALSAPVDTLASNWAYMVMASLAWSLKAWMALLLPEGGRDAEARTDAKRSLLRMEFTTFRRAFMAIPAQIVKTDRRTVFRLLAWNRWLPVFFNLLDELRVPMRY